MRKIRNIGNIVALMDAGFIEDAVIAVQLNAKKIQIIQRQKELAIRLGLLDDDSTVSALGARYLLLKTPTEKREFIKENLRLEI